MRTGLRRLNFATGCVVGVASTFTELPDYLCVTAAIVQINSAHKYGEYVRSKVERMNALCGSSSVDTRVSYSPLSSYIGGIGTGFVATSVEMSAGFVVGKITAMPVKAILEMYK